MKSKLPSKIELAAQFNQNPPDFQQLLQHDEISNCLLRAFSSSTRSDSVQQFSRLAAERDIRGFLKHRMTQLLLLEFEQHRQPASAFLKTTAPLVLQFLESTPLIPFSSWSVYEKQAINSILLFFRDANLPLPPLLKHIDQHLPSFDPAVCMICCQGRYVLQDSEGFLICNNDKCGHQASNLVESRITYGTGYSNELSWTQNKTVTLYEPLPAVSLLLLASSSSPTTTTTTTTSANTTSPSFPSAIFSPYPPLPGSAGFTNVSHERCLHFHESMQPFRGQFYKIINQSVIESLVKHLQSHLQITLIRDLSFPVVRDALRHVWPENNPSPPTNNHVFFALHVLGYSIPYLPEQDYELANFLYQRTEQLWPYYSGGAGGPCLSHSYVVAQIMHLLDRPDIATFFPYAKEGIRNEQFARIFSHIMKHLQEPSTFYSNMPLLGGSDTSSSSIDFPIAL